MVQAVVCRLMWLHFLFNFSPQASKDLECYVQFDGANMYNIMKVKKVHKAPTEFCFCIVVSCPCAKWALVVQKAHTQLNTTQRNTTYARSHNTHHTTQHTHKTPQHNARTHARGTHAQHSARTRTHARTHTHTNTHTHARTHARIIQKHTRTYAAIFLD